MAKRKEEGSGLQSSAGLMRYFEADDASIKLSPKIVVVACIGTGVAVMALNIAFGLWP
ncbi:MAG: preprotein translocase subunit Sec61beta [Methanothrix sp.]|jgi:preprotein translocase subunit Sec61beta|nr:preprotein translocase subunit Sec61beta [Methanothrix sp.]